MTIKQLLLLRRVAAKPDGYLIQPMKTLGGRTAEQKRSDQYRIMEGLQRDGFVERRTERGGLWFLTAAADAARKGDTALARALSAEVVSARLLRSLAPLAPTAAEPTLGDVLRRGRTLCAELARDAEREWAADPRTAKPRPTGR